MLYVCLFSAFLTGMLTYYFRKKPLPRIGEPISSEKIKVVSILDRIALRPRDLSGYGEKLRWAGGIMSPERFYSLKVLLLLFGMVLGIILFFLVQGMTGLFLFLLIAGVPFVGADVYLNLMVAYRRRQIQKELLDAAELLKTATSAGNHFSVAVRELARESDNLVIQEIENCLSEIEAGKEKTRAYRDMVLRNGVPDLEAFVQAVQYNRDLGTPISEFLEKEIERMQSQRRNRIQERGQKIGIQVLLAVVIFMGPAFLMLIFGPLVAEIDFGGLVKIGTEMPGI